MIDRQKIRGRETRSLSYVLRTNRKARFRDEGIETNRVAPRLFHFRLAADKYVAVATVSPRRAPQMRRSCVKIEKLQSWSGRDTANGSRFVACWNRLALEYVFQSVSSRMGELRTRGPRRVLFSNFHNGRRYRSSEEEKKKKRRRKKRNGKYSYVSRYPEAIARRIGGC